jgi:hypothetical protein
VWNPGVEEVFSVKSTYVFLDNTIHPRDPWLPLMSFAFKFIWKSGVPSKVSAFSWQLLLDRVPTRVNLCRRRVVSTDETLCLICQEGVETASHLFLHCSFAAGIWYSLIRWLGAVSVLPSTVPMSYASFVGNGLSRRHRKGLSVVWLAFIWVVWKARNDRVFNNIVIEVPTAFDLIQRLSWKWFVNNTAKSPFLLYEWVWDPGVCMGK